MGWKPRSALRVGVIGNRNFADPAMTTLAAQTSEEIWKELFRSILKVLEETHADIDVCDLFSGERPRVAVLTSLAKGGDQIGAAAALAVLDRDHPAIDVELEAVLPFEERYYPNPADFDPGDRKWFWSLIDRPETRQVVRFDGDYLDKASRVAAYRQASELLLQNSDLVIAIYDPTAPTGAAGTTETICEALGYNTPVIAVQLQRGQATVAVARALENQQPLWDTGPEWRRTVESCVREQIVPPELLERERDEEERGHAILRLQFVSGDEGIPALCRNDSLAQCFTAAWSALGELTSATAWSEVREEVDEASRANDEITLEPYAPLYREADGLARAFMRTYRGAVVLSYFLAGLAVAAAVLIMAAVIVAEGEPPMVLTTILCVVKIAIIVLLLLLEREAHKVRPHEGAVDFRYLTELTRPMQWLSAAGVYPPAVDLPLHTTTDDLRHSWMAWLVRAAARSSPSVSADRFDHPKEVAMTRERAAEIVDDVRTRWIAGQLRYHRRNSAQMKQLGEGIENQAKVLLVTVLIAALAACALEWLHSAKAFAAVLGALAAILPAFIAAFAGIGFQSEAKRLAKRSASMARALDDYQKQLENLAAQLRNGNANHTDVTRLLKKLSSITINEAADWKILFQVHEIHAG